MIPEQDPDSEATTEQLIEAAKAKPDLANKLFPDGLPVSLDDSKFADVTVDQAVNFALDLVTGSESARRQTRGWIDKTAQSLVKSAVRRGSAFKTGALEIRKNLDFILALPYVAGDLSVGTFGLMEHGIFVPLGEISDHAAPVALASTSSRQLHSSSRGVQVSLEVSQDDPVEKWSLRTGSASLRVDFSHDGSHFLQIADVAIERSAEIEELHTVLAELEGNGELPPRAVVVTEVLRAGKGVILIASGDDATAQYFVEIDPSSTPSLPDLFAHSSLTAGQHKDVALSLHLKQPTPVLFRAIQVQRGRLSGSLQFAPIA